MPNSINTLLARHAVEQSIKVLRYSAGVKQQVSALLSRMERRIVAEMAGRTLTDFQDRRYRAMIASVRGLITGTYNDLAPFTDSALRGVMTYVVEDVGSKVRSLTGIDMFGRVADPDWIASIASNSLTQGATNNQWWSRQAGDLAFKFEQQVKLGMVSNETTDQIVRRISGDETFAGVMPQGRANAAALVQTSIAEGANDARLAMYRKNADIIKGVQQLSTLDERTTDICIAYDGAAWDLDGNPIEGNDLPFDGGPPRHWNCRSTLVPVIKSSDELGVDVEVSPGTRASMDGQVSDKMTFGDWLETKTPEQQDAILGKGKAQLWRDDKITLRDLLDQSGRPLTLEQLKERVTR
jgi:SPP1 gp7 family putative phage head morphogenesis protein